MRAGLYYTLLAAKHGVAIADVMKSADFRDFRSRQLLLPEC